MSLHTVWYPLEFSRLHNLHPWYWNSLLYRLISSGANSAVHTLLQLYNSPSLQFSFIVTPGTRYCRVDRGSMIWETCPTPLHMAGSMARAPVTHPSTNDVPHCSTSVIWQELFTTRPYAILQVLIPKENFMQIRIFLLYTHYKKKHIIFAL